ncbi:hypothetical protein KZX46_04060 [Polymorphobacter sp. PAMC 29334]|uniref:hypothetical protein n=1 Tax=Polymorphobacter sp. PAMC 29334 TaxID=2862331 RepID=UPI001C74E7DF|nr:hypothetical protein [Polymorphobacter sp. PAMC 29334]QYE35192.1 hypothetical protein KZX46_04060 [Polymorphobacter sp. PAMC 29334]
MSIALIVLSLLEASAVSGPALGLPASRPTVHADDIWRYKNSIELRGRFSETHDERSVVRTQADAIVLKVHASDSPLQPTELLVGSDWSRFRSVDGHEQVVNRPFDFPLTAGKTWTVDYSESNPNRLLTTEHWVTTYKVVGVERVTVPAGTFDAVKIEATGNWTATLARAVTGVATTRSDAQGVAVANRIDRQQPRDATGRIYKAFWYVPAVKRAVKIVEETYDSGGLRSESRTSELESYKVAQ